MKGMIALRKLLALFLALLLLVSFTVPASAHKGRTDSNGGHRDSATGEYHYHHGYPAHSHYDMDGDGDIDCPYDFDDQTNHNSSNSTGSDSTRTQGLTFNDGYESGYDKGYEDGYDRGHSDGQGYVEKEKDASYEKGYKKGETDMLATFDDKYDKQLSSEKQTAWFVSIAAMLFLGAPVVSAFTLLTQEKGYNHQKQEMERRHRAEIEKLAGNLSAMKAAVADAENRYELLQSGFDPTKSACIPEGVKVVSLVLPVKGRAVKDRPYGDYTVYTSPQGTRYHCRYGCGNATRPVHFFARPANLPPCRNCVPRDMYPQPLPDWYLELIGQKPSPSHGTQQKDAIANPPKKEAYEQVSFIEAPRGATPVATRLGPADEEFTTIRRSSFIRAVCYKGESLYVKTTDGGYFLYYKVPRPVYLDFMNAPSMGKFYRQHISGMYPFSRL